MPARLDWPSAIGLFLLNFGTLDYLVFVFLKDNLSSEEFAIVKEWHFKDRVTRMGEQLKAANYPAANRLRSHGWLSVLIRFVIFGITSRMGIFITALIQKPKSQ